MEYINKQLEGFGATAGQAFTTSDNFAAVGFSGGLIVKATKLASAPVQARGFLLSGTVNGVSVASGDKVFVVRHGKIESDLTAQTPGAQIYLGLAGAISTSIATGGDYIQKLGFFNNATDFVIEMEDWVAS